MYGEAEYGAVEYGAILETTGVAIIPEVALTTRELVFVVEIDLIQPNLASES